MEHTNFKRDIFSNTDRFRDQTIHKFKSHASRRIEDFTLGIRALTGVTTGSEIGVGVSDWETGGWTGA
nr:hypothetical protein [Tanacetum cinerariifolium]